MKTVKSSIILVSLTLIACGFIGRNISNQPDDGQVKTGLNIGDKAPELKYKDPEGKEIALSSLKGKIVLIDFWAAWCRPCRMENPNLVSAYNKYHKAKMKDAKGFEIYSVSLDKTKVQWEKAITQDKLLWKYHVSDLKGWRSAAAKIYGVGSIPANVLIDGNGIILAKNLRGINLHHQLDKLVVKFKKDKK